MTGRVLVAFRGDLEGAQWIVSYDHEHDAHLVTISDQASGKLADVLRLLITGERR